MLREHLDQEVADRKQERANEYRHDVAAYERAGEPDGCYYCGSNLHHSSDCRDEDYCEED